MLHRRKLLLKRAFGWTVDATGLSALCQAAGRRGGLILTYHGVIDRAPESYINRQCVDAEMFDAQLEWLVRHRQVVPLMSMVELLEAEQALPERSVAITFDDGLRNILTTAVPLLRKHRAPATIFLCTGHVGAATPLWLDEVNALVMHATRPVIASPVPGDRRQFALDGEASREQAASAIRSRLKSLAPDPREKALAALRASCQAAFDRDEAWVMRHSWLDWNDVRALRDHGCDIGAHGESHTTLTALGRDLARVEARASRQAIERETGRPCVLFSYPNGRPTDFSPDSRRMLREEGFRAAVTQVGGLNAATTDRMTLRRINVSRVASMAYFRAEISQATGWVGALPARLALRAWHC